MTNTEKFMDLIETQRVTDDLIYKKMHLLNPPQLKDYKLAIVDEIGELNHELKPMWCWWQKNPKPLDWDRVLAELVDVWHFCISYLAHNVKFDLAEFADQLDYDHTTFYDPIEFLEKFEYFAPGTSQMSAVFETLIGMGNNFGLDFGQVYDAYKKKNEENNERAKSAY